MTLKMSSSFRYRRVRKKEHELFPTRLLAMSILPAEISASESDGIKQGWLVGNIRVLDAVV